MKKIIKFLLLIFCFVSLVSCGGPNGSQTISSTKSTKYYLKFVSSDISNYPTIRLYYKIYDTDGNIINNYVIKKAILTEKLINGEYISREVKVHENISKKQGLNTSLVIDKSGSISDDDMNKIKNVMSSFISNMDFKVGDKSEIVTFNADVFNTCPFTNDINLLNNSIDTIQPYGSTAVFDAIHSGISHASLQGGARCVIAFTDGYDNASLYNPNQVVDFSIKQQVPVYIIGVGSSLDEYSLKDIATKTGGKYWNIDNLSNLESIFDEIYGIEKSTYYIEYVTDFSGDQKYNRRYISVSFDDGKEYIDSENDITPVKPAKIGHDASISFSARLRDMNTVSDFTTEDNIDDLDSIPFGKYEQDGNDGNGKEEIDWIILKRENGMAMLLSKYILDCKEYNVTKENTSWPECSLRSWLNSEFFDEAFDADDKRLIPTVTVQNIGNTKMSNTPNTPTEDKVYLLDDHECLEFFGEPSETNQIVQLSTYGTEYAKNNRLFVAVEDGQWYSGNSTFWLRSPGQSWNRAGNVTYCGFFYQDGNSVNFKLNGIRPVIWVKYE